MMKWVKGHISAVVHYQLNKHDVVKVINEKLSAFLQNDICWTGASYFMRGLVQWYQLQSKIIPQVLLMSDTMTAWTRKCVCDFFLNLLPMPCHVLHTKGDCKSSPQAHISILCWVPKELVMEDFTYEVIRANQGSLSSLTSLWPTAFWHLTFYCLLQFFVLHSW